MADPFNLTTQYERQLAGVGDALRTLPDAIQSGFTMGIQRRNQRLNERLLNEQIRGLETENSINEQILQKPATLVDAFGELKTDEDRLKFLAQNSGIAATPAGARLLSHLEGIADTMARRKLSSLEYQGELAAQKQQIELAIKHGVNPKDPVAMKSAMRSESLEQLTKLFNDNGRRVTADLITDDLFDESNRLNMPIALARLEQAPLTEALQIQRDRLDAENLARKPARDPGSAQPILMGGKPTGKAILNDGSVIDLPLDRTKSLTEGQAKALNYSERMEFNNRIIKDLMANTVGPDGKVLKKGFDPTTFKSAVQDKGPNALASTDFQKYDAARRNWVAAILRQESGAAISESEYKNAFDQYFPRFGDAPEVVKQKADLRELAENKMRQAVGDISADRGLNSPAAVATPTQRPRFNSLQEASDAGLPIGTEVEWYDPQTAKLKRGVVE